MSLLWTWINSNLSIDERLFDFYFHVLGFQTYKGLAYIIKIILALGHGEAAIERGVNLECQHEYSCVKENR